jgi:hypothetical protein
MVDLLAQQLRTVRAAPPSLTRERVPGAKTTYKPTTALERRRCAVRGRFIRSGTERLGETEGAAVKRNQQETAALDLAFTSRRGREEASQATAGQAAGAWKTIGSSPTHGPLRVRRFQL